MNKIKLGGLMNKPVNNTDEWVNEMNQIIHATVSEYIDDYTEKDSYLRAMFEDEWGFEREPTSADWYELEKIFDVTIVVSNDVKIPTPEQWVGKLDMQVNIHHMSRDK